MKNIQCKRCFFFTPEWCPQKRDSLDPDLIRDCQYYRTKTNADRIRSMSDEELAAFLNRHGNIGCSVMGKWESGMCSKPCEECWLEWLKQEGNR